MLRKKNERINERINNDFDQINGVTIKISSYL